MTDPSDTSRERKWAAVGTAVFGLAPATAAGLVPWLLTRWEVQSPVPGGAVSQVAGVLLVGAGASGGGPGRGLRQVL
jgi:hypothetical protein